ncbi:MAG: crossover junction endodeoxyribonuclease RuvC [Candidatus Gracilibacteria bacterium]
MNKNLTRLTYMRILGIDPGTAITGYAILDTSGQTLTVRDLGCITTDKKSTQAEKLVEISESLCELLEMWKPEEIAIEKLFFAKNVTTAVTVAQARGVILHTIQQRGLGHCEYTPKEIKLAVCGSGSADKKAVQKMVQILCNLKTIPQIDDAADAIAAAICHAQQLPIRRLAHNKTSLLEAS